MHFSDNPDNFRNRQYIDNMKMEFKHTFRAYFKYISYRNKLLNELTIDEEQKEEIKSIDERFIKNINRAYKRINKENFKIK